MDVTDIILLALAALATARGLYLWNREEDETDQMVRESASLTGKRHD